MKYKIQFDLICPESDDDGDLRDPNTYDKDTVFESLHSKTYDQEWIIKHFKIKESK